MKLEFYVKVEEKCPSISGGKKESEETKKVEEWVQKLKNTIGEQSANKIAKEVFVRIDFYRKKKSIVDPDIDNQVNTVLNALVKTEIMKDDKYVVKLDAQKLEAEKDFTEVWVFSFS